MTRHRVAAVALIAALLATARAEIFVSIDVPKDIPDHDTTGITSTVTVDLEGPVSDVNLRLDDLGHTCDADLHVELTPPSGTAVVLLTSFSENGILTGLGWCAPAYGPEVS